MELKRATADVWYDFGFRCIAVYSKAYRGKLLGVINCPDQSDQYEARMRYLWKIHASGSALLFDVPMKTDERKAKFYFVCTRSGVFLRGAWPGSIAFTMDRNQAVVIENDQKKADEMLAWLRSAWGSSHDWQFQTIWG
jgi:hypothetical protein